MQPLVYSKHTIESASEFVDILKDVPVSKTMVSFDVVSLFTNVPLSDTIEIILDELFDSTGQSEYLAELNCETSRSDTKKLLEQVVGNRKCKIYYNHAYITFNDAFNGKKAAHESIYYHMLNFMRIIKNPFHYSKRFSPPTFTAIMNV